MRFTRGKLTKSPAYIVANWPRSLRAVECLPFARHYSAAGLVDLCHWAGLSSAPRLRQHGISYQAVKRLAGMAAADRHSASYHQSGHTAHVIVAAGLLAAIDGLSQQDTDTLIFAALVHDLDHGGYHRCRQLYHAELWSAQKAVAVLSHTMSDPRIAVRVTDMLVATSFVADPLRDAALAADPLAAYLVDADLFASLFYRVSTAHKLSALIKQEERDPAPLPMILARFVSVAKAHGFYTDAAAQLHSQLAAGHSVLHADDTLDDTPDGESG